MRIAVFDYRVLRSNPVGSCHRALLEALCHDHEFTVFATRFDNPCPGRINWVRVPVPSRPQALLFVTYHLVAPLTYLLQLAWRRKSYDLVQLVESNLAFGDLSYVHFCHGGFLRRETARRTTVRGWLRWLDHRLHAMAEPWVFARIRRIVVPSQGLARELLEEYPRTAAKVDVIPNAVDLDRMRPAEGFDRRTVRSKLGIHDTDIGIVFAALGHFERKGLPLLLEGLRQLDDARFKLVVIGGQPSLVKAYQAAAGKLGVGSQVAFVGMQDDVRPFLWAGDIFALPSAYEVFPLAALEAGAAGLPLLATELDGLRDLLVDGETGYVVDRTGASIAAGLRRFGGLPDGRRQLMGTAVRSAAQRYGLEHFIAGWTKLYAGLEAEGSRLDEDA
jgi:glycosyltransferase involved in cell wall biosynthesis